MMPTKNKAGWLSVPLSCLALSLFFAGSCSAQDGVSLWVVNNNGSPDVDLYLKSEEEHLLAFRFQIADNNTITSPQPVRGDVMYIHVSILVACTLHELTDDWPVSADYSRLL